MGLAMRRGAAAVLSLLVALPAVAVAQDSDADAADPPPRVACTEASAVFDVLCASYEILTNHYVDELSDDVWAAAAAQGVRNAQLAPRGPEAPPACPLPAAAFEQVCAEIDAADDTSAAAWAAAGAMFAAPGDPNTFLMNLSQFEAMQQRLATGDPYVGIGLSLGLLDGTRPCFELSETCRLAVAEVFAGSPAQRAGLQADDLIVSIDGYVPEGAGCGVDGLHQLDQGRVVPVVVERDGLQRRFGVEVDSVLVPPAKGRVVAGDIGYLRLDSFELVSDELMAGELGDLIDAGVDKLVVDLRGNRGGYLNTVVNIASMFLERSRVVVQELSRTGTMLHRVSGHSGLARPALLPVAVAVDDVSASASEVLALALRDHGRGTVVGTTTFGKNTGQLTQGLEGRDGTMLGGAQMTVFRWLSPNGNSAAGGITPDVAAELSGCWHPLGVARHIASSADLPGAVAADLEIGSERYEAVESLLSDGVLKGAACAPGWFCPGDAMPRWLMAVWLVRVVDGAEPAPVGSTRFEDVDAGEWWAAHVERLADLGITVGCSREPALYCPDAAVTRAQMATFLQRAFSLRPAIPAGFVDTEGSSHAAAIDALADTGITRGCSTEPLRFCPSSLTTRAHAALFLERARSQQR